LRQRRVTPDTDVTDALQYLLSDHDGHTHQRFGYGFGTGKSLVV
jgi:hypothetical protein